MAEIKLDTKLVGGIEGKFFVRSYQRGYRWGEEEVRRLLDDIYENMEKNYCLQPIVVKNEGEQYELIDGQQRLTTLFLIYKYMNEASGGFLDEPRFSLTYETREESTGYLLKDIDLSRKEENIDFWFICNAYETITDWFSSKEKKSVLTNVNKFFDENVKVIWYEVDESQDANELFTRLNIGKIPLTSAELVKAMFLCSARNVEPAMAMNEQSSNLSLDIERQEEISLQWDNIERELHDDSLWYFLTNRNNSEYQTRIDLVLDMMVEKPIGNKEIYYTFFAFDERKKEEKLVDIWAEIQRSFLILKDWFETHDYYHKIGYLIASESNSLIEIFNMYKGQPKSSFVTSLEGRIKESISINKNYGELSYESETDRGNISKLLLLFNVESVRKNGEGSQWFPFDKFKFEAGSRTTWSLEHIHAQQSEGMKTEKVWKEWLSLHMNSLSSLSIDNEELMESVRAALNRERLERKEFEELQQQIIKILSAGGSTEYLHSIANIALLNTGANAALSNSTFDVKRNEIIKMDKAGQYIPFCTKMVFLKYYTPSDSNQLHFWGQADRDAYIEAINNTLEAYLPDVISIEKEVQ